MESEHKRLSQPQINTVRTMPSTYQLWTRQHMRFGQPQINQQKKRQVHTGSANMPIHGTQSASDRHSKGNVKHLLAANMSTHEIQSASDQPCKDNVKHVRAMNASTQGLRQPRINTARTQSSTYQLQTGQQIRFDQPHLRSTRQGNFQTRTHCEQANTVSLRSTQ